MMLSGFLGLMAMAVSLWMPTPGSQSVLTLAAVDVGVEQMGLGGFR
jgi:hypothetical protein